MRYIPHTVTEIFSVSELYSVFYFELNKDFAEEAESHDFWELVYAESGKVYLESDGETVYLQEGDLYIHKPNQQHRFRGNNINASRVFIASFACSAPEMLFFVNKILKADETSKYEINLLLYAAKATLRIGFSGPGQVVCSIAENAPLGGDQMIANLLELLLLNLYSQKATKHIRPLLSKELIDNELVNSVIALLEENLFENPNIKEIAAKTNYSVSTVSTYFKEHTHYSIAEYHTILKMEYAKTILKETDKSVCQIAGELGFCNQHYFSNVFKKYMKMTPSEYRKSVRSLIRSI